MVLQLFLPLIKLQLRIIRILNYCPFAFDESTQQFVVNQSTLERWSLRLFQTLQWIYMASTLIPVRRLWKIGCYGKSMEGVLVFSITLICLTCSTFWSPNKTAIQLMNAMMKFDEKFLKGELI